MKPIAKFYQKAFVLAVLTLLFCSNAMLAQSIRLGRVTPDDFIQGVYEKDPDASAVILYDFGENVFDLNTRDGLFFYDHKRTMRMQILDERAFEFADYSIGLFETPQNRETLSGFRAFVHNLEGNRVVTTQVRTSDILTEQTTENLKTLKFTFPEVKPGSIIELTYAVRSQRLFSPRAWQFQYSIPVEYSEFQFLVPEYYNYNFFVQGFEIPVVHERKPIDKTYMLPLSGGGTQTVHSTNILTRWVMKDLPALGNEPFTTNIANYYSALFFELASEVFPGSKPVLYVSSWSDVDKLLRDSDYFGKFLSGTRQLRNEMSGLASDDANDEEKIASVMTWFHNNIRWNERNSISAGSTARQVISRGSGNSAEINLLLVAALREMGLKANPVVSSTRSNGIVVTAFPTINRFNYVLAAVELENNKLLLLDATDPMCPIGMLPLRAINFNGRLIDVNSARWVNLQVEAPRKETFEVVASIKPDGIMEGFMTITASDYAAYISRRSIKDHNSLDEYKESFKKSYPKLEISEFNIEEVEDISVPLKKRAAFSSSDGIQKAADFIFFKPILIKGLDENPFKLEERKFPVDFSVPVFEDLTMVYEIPEGFVIDHLPAGANFRFGNGAQYSFESSMNDEGKIVIRSVLQINRSIFAPNDYRGLKEFFGKIAEKQNEQIVLKASF